MGRRKNLIVHALALGLLFGLRAQPALACAACAGQSNDLQAQGMNWGIFSLLIVVVGVLGGIGAFSISLARRAARFPNLPVQDDLLAAGVGTAPVKATMGGPTEILSPESLRLGGR